MEAPRAEAFLAERMDAPPKLRLYRRPDGRLIDSECPRGDRERRRRLLSLLGLAVAIGGFVALIR